MGPLSTTIATVLMVLLIIFLLVLFVNDLFSRAESEPAVADRKAKQSKPAENHAAEPPVEPSPSRKKPDSRADPTGSYKTRPSALPSPKISSAPKPTLKATFSRLEEAFAGKWFVWLGAVTLALAGFFMIREMAEHGYFPPMLRIALAFGVGILLTTVGEWLRRRPLQRQIAARMQDFVPSALVAAGLLTCLASTYASAELYSFIGTSLAMAVVSAITLAAFALSLRHGPLVALLGLVGGFAAPIAVSTGIPNAYGLFGYFSPIVVGALAVGAHRRWNWLVQLTLSIAAVWGAVWVILMQGAGDAGALVMFAGVLGIAALISTDIKLRRDGLDEPLSMTTHNPDIHEAGLGVAVSLFLVVLGVVNDTFTSAGLTALAVYAAVISGSAFVATRRYKAMAAVGLAAIVGVLSAWCGFLVQELLPAPLGRGDTIDRLMTLSGEQQRFLIWATGFGLACGAFGTWRVLKDQAKTLWSGYTCIASAGLFLITYLAAGDLFGDMVWAFAAFAIAAGLAALSGSLLSRRTAADCRNALSWLTLASGSMIIAGLAILLGEAWLTIALSALVPAAVAIAVWSGHRPILYLAGAVAVAVIFRLTAYPFLFDYAPTALFGRYWVIYGYGLPFLAFAAAHEILERAKSGGPVGRLIDLGRTGLFVLFYSATVRAVLGEPSKMTSIGLLEAGAHLSGWLMVGYFRLRSWVAKQRLTDMVTANILLIAGTTVLAFGPLVLLNPVMFQVDVAGGLIFNALTVSLLVPALAYFAISVDRGVVSTVPWVERPAKVLSLILVFIWATLQVRHGFHMTDMRFLEPVLPAEQYAYSAVWLVLSLACFITGIRLDNQGLRFGGLTILSLTIGKVFLLDLSALEGLLRVGSFFGLGLSLIAIGYVYQRFVFKREATIGSKAT